MCSCWSAFLFLLIIRPHWYSVVLTTKNGMSLVLCVHQIDDISGSNSLIFSLKILFLYSYAIVLLLCVVCCAIDDRVVGDALLGLVFLCPSFVLLLSLVVDSSNGMILISPTAGILASTVLPNLKRPGTSNQLRNNLLFWKTWFTLVTIFVNKPWLKIVAIVVLFASGFDE